MYTARLPWRVHVFSERVEGVLAPALGGPASHREANRLICACVCVCACACARVY